MPLEDNKIYEVMLPLIKLPYTWVDDKAFEEFFRETVNVQRLLYCPSINVDLTDDMGMFGYEKGFIFIEATQREGLNCFNDQHFLQGQTLERLGKIYRIRSYDYFPRGKYQHELVTETRQPFLYKWLKNRFL